MSKDSGWIKLQRSLLESALWNTNEPFSKRCAYIDLLLRANYKEKTMILKHTNQPFIVPEGALATSFGKLAQRWAWSIGKVRRFLIQLTDLEMISLTTYPHGILVSLTNRAFQPNASMVDGIPNEHGDGIANEHSDGITDSITDGITGGIRLKKGYKKDKNTKKEKEIKKASPSFDDLWGDPE